MLLFYGALQQFSSPTLSFNFIQPLLHPPLHTVSLHRSHPSTPLLFSLHISVSLSPPPPCSLSLPGSLPSVCLCAWGAGCYLDDLVREGERDFISCLPEGLWYLWCYKAALLKKPTFGCGGAQWLSGLRFSMRIWPWVLVLGVGVHLWACDTRSATRMPYLYSSTYRRWTQGLSGWGCSLCCGFESSKWVYTCGLRVTTVL